MMPDTPAPIPPPEETPRAPQPIVMTITAVPGPGGGLAVGVEGPIEDAAFCDAMLMAAHDAIRDHNRRRALERSVLVAGEGLVHSLDAARVGHNGRK